MNLQLSPSLARLLSEPDEEIQQEVEAAYAFYRGTQPDCPTFTAHWNSLTKAERKAFIALYMLGKSQGVLESE